MKASLEMDANGVSLKWILLTAEGDQEQKLMASINAGRCAIGTPDSDVTANLQVRLPLAVKA
jgi:hypothetical protein